MKNLLIITQKVDERDDLLGFFVGWLREFAKRYDQVYVVTLAKGYYDLPANIQIYSLGKEKNNSKISRIFKFYKLLIQLTPKSDSIFAHMSPIFVVAAWPVAILFRKKIILWYLHRSLTLRLKLAEKLSYKIVTADKDSLTLKSPKIIEVGHGIDIEKFKADPNKQTNLSQELKILSVGRISKIKNYDTLLEAIKIIKDKNLNFKLTVIGRPVRTEDDDYLKQLNKKINDLDIGDVVELVGFIPYSKIADYYRRADLVINLTPTGGIDKTVLEGMASGCLTLVSNRVFEKYFGAYSDLLLFDYQSATDLAVKIENISKMTTEHKKEISNFLTVQASKYSIKSVVENIVKIFP